MKKYSEIVLIILICSAMIYLIGDAMMDYRTANAICNETFYRKSYGIRTIEGNDMQFAAEFPEQIMISPF